MPRAQQRLASPAGGDSRALVRRTLLQWGPLSRAELAERTGLSRPAITAICHELVALGQVRDTGARSAGRSAVGRRRVHLDLCADAGYALGVLVAAENSAVSVLDLKGQLLDSIRVQPPLGDATDVLGFLAAAAAQRLSGLRLDPGQLVGIGVSMPGVVDSARGNLRVSPFFNWADVAVRPPFEARFGPRVSVANPLQAIAVAELLFGSASRVPRADLVLVNVSTAIGAAFVLGGQLQHGAEDASGQIGHVIVEPNGRTCRCGRRGCLDALASGDALLAGAADQGQPYAGFADLLAAAAGGDRAALALLDDSATRVGQAVGDVITMLNPAVVAVSGMVLQLGARYVDRLRAAAATRAWRVGDTSPRIVASAFGVEAGAVGAAALALQDFVYAARPG